MAETVTKAAPTSTKKSEDLTAMGLMFNPQHLTPPSRAGQHTYSVQALEETNDKRPGRDRKLVTRNIAVKRGLNVVHPKDLEVLQEYYVKHFASGALEPISLGDSVGDNGSLKNLLALRDGDAVRVANMENKREVLDRWSTEERRPVVASAIQSRITALSKGLKKGI